jgi:sigma-B regulation protein RsbU (phosphoserine phosphatase)
MSQKLLTLVIGVDGGPVPDLVEQVLSRWSGEGRPATQVLTLEQVADQVAEVTRTAVAWVLLPEGAKPDLATAQASLQEMRVPVMLSVAGATDPMAHVVETGSLACPLDADPAVAEVLLRALWSQCQTIDELRTEVRFIQSHHGKLCDQIDKIDEELRLAAQLQREFLPAELPSLFNVEFRTLFRPAGYVSGDIYDVVRLDEKHVGIFIADAVGHGVPAALLTMYIKRSLHTKEVDAKSPRGYRIIPPDEALAKLNHDMCQQNVGGQIRFATAIYGIINCQTLELQCARAGHPFPLLLRANGKTLALEPDGGMLGVFPEETFELQRIKLAAGDRLLVYSDGFEVAFPETRTRAKGRSVPSPSHHYTRELEDLANGTLDEALARLGARLDEQIGSLNQLDDLTVVAMGIGSNEPLDDSPAERRLMAV